MTLGSLFFPSSIGSGPQNHHLAAQRTLLPPELSHCPGSYFSCLREMSILVHAYNPCTQGSRSKRINVSQPAGIVAHNFGFRHLES